jgi:hypothetical protein
MSTCLYKFIIREYALEMEGVNGGEAMERMAASCGWYSSSLRVTDHNRPFCWLFRCPLYDKMSGTHRGCKLSLAPPMCPATMRTGIARFVIRSPLIQRLDRHAVLLAAIDWVRAAL